MPCPTAEHGTMVHVRAANPRDLDTLADFNAAMAMETESKVLSYTQLVGGVQYLLDHPEDGRYWVAEDEADGVVGALMLTYEWSDWRNARFWWIQSVYVLPDWRGRGVYSTLHRHVRAQAREQADVCGLRLYVERNNGHAQAVYRALGMHETAYDLYEEDFQEDMR
jgi:GNAT superfamily N-acetyltransferase